MPPKFDLPDSIKKRLNVISVIESCHGGQKYVFKVQCNLGICVIKMFIGGLTERGRRELEFYISNSHLDGIPKLLEVVDDNGEAVIIEEFIEGQCLDKITKSYVGKGEKIRKLIRNICSILVPIWENHQIHRDLKPSNIIIKPNGMPVVLDFGIFRDASNSTITSTDFQPRSWAFAAPEQYFSQKQSIGYRTDFFSLGVIAYYLYYGTLPFGNTEQEIEQRFLDKDTTFTTDAQCPINNFLYNALQFDVFNRPRTSYLLMEALER